MIVTGSQYCNGIYNLLQLKPHARTMRKSSTKRDRHCSLPSSLLLMFKNMVLAKASSLYMRETSTTAQAYHDSEVSYAFPVPGNLRFSHDNDSDRNPVNIIISSSLPIFPTTILSDSAHRFPRRGLWVLESYTPSQRWGRWGSYSSCPSGMLSF